MLLPLCPGDLANHLDGLSAVTKYRRTKELDRLPGLQQASEPGPPSRPKRDASRTIFAWPLRHPRLPGDAGCIPPSALSARKWASIAVMEFERRLPDGLGPAWVGLGFDSPPLLLKPHRLRLSHNTCDSREARRVSEKVQTVSLAYASGFHPSSLRAMILVK